MKIKQEYLDKVIYNPFSMKDVMCKFIDERLYVHLVKIYPNIFEEKEIEKDVISKKGKSISDSINLDSNSEGEVNIK
jgi:hypothetical protein